MEFFKVSRAEDFTTTQDTACLGTNRTGNGTPGTRDRPGRGQGAGTSTPRRAGTGLGWGTLGLPEKSKAGLTP